MRDVLRIVGRFRLEFLDHKTQRLLKRISFENLIVNEGLDNYVIKSLGGIAGAKHIAYVALAKQTTPPNPTDTTVLDEVGGRKTTSNTLITPGILKMTATWAATDNPDPTLMLGAVASFDVASGGAACSIANFPSPQEWTNTQVINLTYEIQIA